MEIVITRQIVCSLSLSRSVNFVPVQYYFRCIIGSVVIGSCVLSVCIVTVIVFVERILVMVVRFRGVERLRHFFNFHRCERGEGGVD